MAVHGTNLTAWQTIGACPSHIFMSRYRLLYSEKVGLSPMKRTHIHMAQTTDKAKGANPGALSLRNDENTAVLTYRGRHARFITSTHICRP